MRRSSSPKKRIQTLTTALFLLGLAILFIVDQWWPGIMLVIGVPLALRQYLLGKTYDAGISLFVFIGIFVTGTFDISWKILLPVLFTLAAVYLLIREFVEPSAEE